MAQAMRITLVAETFGNIVTEGMASGLAVLTYDDAGRQHITPQTDGLLAKFDDAEDFLDQAGRLAEDPDLVRVLGAQARRTAAGIPGDTIAQLYETHLLEVLIPGEADRKDGA